MKYNVLSIQALRGIAALMVVIRHCLENMYSADNMPLIVSRIHQVGAAGVDIFFVISGFIMVYTSYNQFETVGAPKRFLLRRLIRVAPMYWLVTTALLLGLLFVPGAFGSLKFQLWHVIASYTFLPAYSSSGALMPLLIPGWTLVYEMYFYLLFAILLMAPRRFFLLAMFVYFAGSVAIKQFFLQDSQSPFVLVYFNFLPFEFLIGCGIGFLLREGKISTSSQSIVLIVMAVVIFSMSVIFGRPTIHRLFYYGIPAGLLVAGCIFFERNYVLKIPSSLLGLGNASYSLYLVHVPVIAVSIKIFNMVLGKHQPEVLVFSFLLSASIVSGLISYKFFETPINEYLQKRFD